MKKILLIIALFPILVSAQDVKQETKDDNKKIRAKEVGEFQLGMRSTVSLFDQNGYPGLGIGGMFRMRPGKRINTEWYADYIKTDIAGLGHRETIHIGWSVMLYLLKTETVKGKLTPYLIGGNCFDYAKISTNLYYPVGGTSPVSQSTDRYTTAVQAGLGTSYFLTDAFNISFSGQFMQHIGKDIHADIVNTYGEEVKDKSLYSQQGNYIQIEQGKPDVVLSGHLLLTMSLNVTIGDMAK